MTCIGEVLVDFNLAIFESLKVVLNGLLGMKSSCTLVICSNASLSCFLLKAGECTIECPPTRVNPSLAPL